eukprot:1189083-Prorocentrum_minimum.AAC.1
MSLQPHRVVVCCLSPNGVATVGDGHQLNPHPAGALALGSRDVLQKDNLRQYSHDRANTLIVNHITTLASLLVGDPVAARWSVLPLVFGTTGARVRKRG